MKTTKEEGIAQVAVAPPQRIEGKGEDCTEQLRRGKRLPPPSSSTKVRREKLENPRKSKGVSFFRISVQSH